MLGHYAVNGRGNARIESSILSLGAVFPSEVIKGIEDAGLFERMAELSWRLSYGWLHTVLDGVRLTTAFQAKPRLYSIEQSPAIKHEL
jgi:hypothetical protein